MHRQGFHHPLVMSGNNFLPSEQHGPAASNHNFAFNKVSASDVVTSLPMKKRKSPLSSSLNGSCLKKRYSDDENDSESDSGSDPGSRRNQTPVEEEEDAVMAVINKKFSSDEAAVRSERALAVLASVAGESSSRNAFDSSSTLPRLNDVLIGKGPDCFHHIGNRRFRVLVEISIGAYFSAAPGQSAQSSSVPTFKQDQIADQVIRSINGNDPPGRFLVRHQSMDISSPSSNDQSVLEVLAGSWRVATRDEAMAKVHSTFSAAGRFLVHKAVMDGAELTNHHNERNSSSPKIEAIGEDVLPSIKDSIKQLENMVRLEREKARDPNDRADSPSSDADMSLETAPPVSNRRSETPQNPVRRNDSPISPSCHSRQLSSSPSPSSRSLSPQTSPAETTRMQLEETKTETREKTLTKCPPKIAAFRTEPLETYFVQDDPEANSNPYANMIVPTNYDILCGVGQAYFHHIGNRRFRILVEMNVHRYEQLFNSQFKKESPCSPSSASSTSSHNSSRESNICELVDTLTQSLSRCDPPGRFLGMESSTGRWRVLNLKFAQLKTEQTFFECMQVKMLQAKRFAAMSETQEEPRTNYAALNKSPNSNGKNTSNLCSARKLPDPSSELDLATLQSQAKELLRRRQCGSSVAALESMGSKLQPALAMSEIMRKFCHEQSEASRALLRKLHTVCPNDSNSFPLRPNQERRNSFPMRTPTLDPTAPTSSAEAIVEYNSQASNHEVKNNISTRPQGEHPYEMGREFTPSRGPDTIRSAPPLVLERPPLPTSGCHPVNDLLDVVGGMMMMSRRTSM